MVRNADTRPTGPICREQWVSDPEDIIPGNHVLFSLVIFEAL